MFLFDKGFDAVGRFIVWLLNGIASIIGLVFLLAWKLLTLVYTGFGLVCGLVLRLLEGILGPIFTWLAPLVGPIGTKLVALFTPRFLFRLTLAWLLFVPALFTISSLASGQMVEALVTGICEAILILVAVRYRREIRKTDTDLGKEVPPEP